MKYFDNGKDTKQK